MTMNFPSGLYTVIVTPFIECKETGKTVVDYESLCTLLTKQIDEGVRNFVTLGTTSEAPTLNKCEKEIIASYIYQFFSSRDESLFLVAGVNGNCTEMVLSDMNKLERYCDGFMVTVPHYNKPPQRCLYSHFKDVAENTKKPVMVYNVPGRTAKNISIDTVKKLADINNIKAIKEASGDLDQVADLCAQLTDDFYIYSGDDNLILPVLSVGGHGVVSVASHLVGDKIKEMINLFKIGEISKAIELNKSLLPIFKSMFIKTNPIPVKESLNIIGMDVGNTRSPLISLADDEKEELKNVFEENNII